MRLSQHYVCDYFDLEQSNSIDGHTPTWVEKMVQFLDIPPVRGMLREQPSKEPSKVAGPFVCVQDYGHIIALSSCRSPTLPAQAVYSP